METESIEYGKTRAEVKSMAEKVAVEKNLQGHKVADRDSKRVSQSYHCDMEIPQLMYVWIQSTRKEFVLIIIY